MMSKGFDLAIDNVFHLFKLETSHLYYGNRTLQVIVHVPAYRPATLMDLYKYSPMPMLVPGKGRSSQTYWQTKVETEYIAVAKAETTFQTFTYEPLQTCNNVFNLFICPNNNVIDKRTSKECLLALFQSNRQEIRKLCPWEMSVKHVATQLNDTAFLLYIPPPREERIVF